MSWIPGDLPPPVGWDWAAHSLEFVAPNPLVRSISRGVPALIPTIADARKQRRTLKEDGDAKITAEESQENANHPTDTRTQIILEETLFHLDDLIADTSGRVRLDEHASGPVRQAPKGNIPENPISGTTQLNRWISKSRGKKTPQMNLFVGDIVLVPRRNPKLLPKARSRWTRPNVVVALERLDIAFSCARSFSLLPEFDCL